MPRRVGVCFEVRKGKVVAARKESANYNHVISHCSALGLKVSVWIWETYG